MTIIDLSKSNLELALEGIDYCLIKIRRELGDVTELEKELFTKQELRRQRAIQAFLINTDEE